MANEKKFLDQAGVQYLWSQLSLHDYPNNETLVAVINAIDETKADAEHTHVITDITDMPEIAQADWNENNPESASYVANRTHYVSGSTETPVLEQMTVTAEDNMDFSRPIAFIRLTVDTPIVEGETYIVTLDGMRYECTPKVMKGDFIWCELGGDDEPFLLSADATGEDVFGHISAIEVETAGSHTVEVAWAMENVIKIPEKYLPEGATLGARGNGKSSVIFNDTENSMANGDYSFSEGSSYANAEYSHSEGYATIALSSYQHVQGKWNVEDANNTYAHIVGNGTRNSRRSNAYTLDWDGNGWYAGDIYTGGTSQSDATKVSLEGHTHAPSDITGVTATAAEINHLSGVTSNVQTQITNLSNELDNYYLKTEADVLHQEMEDYVDAEVAALVGAAPETLDTIGELAAAFEQNQTVIEALDASITNKQNKISDTLILVDTVTGIQHKIQIQNGQLVSFPIE